MDAEEESLEEDDGIEKLVFTKSSHSMRELSGAEAMVHLEENQRKRLR